MIGRAGRWLIVVVAFAVLSACNSGDTTPDDDNAPILTGFDSMPKELATIELTPTPTPVFAGGQSVDVAQPTPTMGRPAATVTLTPYVGVFLGQPTAEGGQVIPDTAPTPAPLALNPGPGEPSISGQGAPAAVTGGCTTPVAATFANAYNTTVSVQEKLGCPVNAGAAQQLVAQSFEHGYMYWRDTGQIYALADNGQFWQVPDNWNDSLPADDPAFAAPDGRLQPVRGFGLAWRNDAALREALGWGIQAEAPVSSQWQDFERGAMFLGGDNRVYALYMSENRHSGPLAN
ncbi:MAG: hypothetical protein JW966_03990 [Anaerolineae bacterium]|nr:hypothetical protein [Anaerolineae bacterium]